MMQSRLNSIVEAVMNTLIGFWISFIAQLMIYPRYGAHFSFMENIQIGLLFLSLSLVRSYVIRRFFNAMVPNAAIKLIKRIN